jgi:hypothetical protein
MNETSEELKLYKERETENKNKLKQKYDCIEKELKS